MNESRLLYEVMREVGKHAAVYRCQAGSPKLADGTRYSGLPKGFSDIMAVLPGGRVAFIECKAGSSKTTPEQDKFLLKMRELGAMAGVARSVDDAMGICGLI